MVKSGRDGMEEEKTFPLTYSHSFTFFLFLFFFLLPFSSSFFLFKDFFIHESRIQKNIHGTRLWRNLLFFKRVRKNVKLNMKLNVSGM